LLELLVEHPGLHDGEAILRCDAQDGVHALEGEHDAAVVRNSRTGRTGPAPPRDERDACIAAEHDQSRDLRLVGGEDDASGQCV
jgi:hypothetical protein